MSLDWSWSRWRLYLRFARLYKPKPTPKNNKKDDMVMMTIQYHLSPTLAPVGVNWVVVVAALKSVVVVEEITVVPMVVVVFKVVMGMLVGDKLSHISGKYGWITATTPTTPSTDSKQISPLWRTTKKHPSFVHGAQSSTMMQPKNKQKNKLQHIFKMKHDMTQLKIHKFTFNTNGHQQQHPYRQSCHPFSTKIQKNKCIKLNTIKLTNINVRNIIYLPFHFAVPGVRKWSDKSLKIQTMQQFMLLTNWKWQLKKMTDRHAHLFLKNQKKELYHQI